MTVLTSMRHTSAGRPVGSTGTGATRSIQSIISFVMWGTTSQCRGSVHGTAASTNITNNSCAAWDGRCI